MGHTTVECGSGLVVVVREFRVSDEDILANRRAQKKGISQTNLLRAITVTVEDSGPYEMQTDGSPNWDKVLHGDRMVIFKENRIATLGEIYATDKPCKSVLCDETIHVDVDLSKLPTQKLPESSLAHARNPKVPIYVVLPSSGARIGFKLLRGRDDRAMQKLQKQNREELSSALIRYQIMDIQTPAPEGTKISEAKDKWVAVPQPDWKQWIRDMSMKDSSFLRAEQEKADCGVDQSVEFYCEGCSLSWEADIQFQADFLFPKSVGSSSTTK